MPNSPSRQQLKKQKVNLDSRKYRYEIPPDDGECLPSILPPELLVETFSFLENGEDLYALMLVNRQCHDLIQEDSIWMRLFEKSFGASCLASAQEQKEASSWKQIYRAWKQQRNDFFRSR